MVPGLVVLLPKSPRLSRLASLAVVVGIAALIVSTAEANPHGWVGVSQTGCTCHASQPSPNVVPRLSGLPQNYTPGTVYPLEVAVEGGPPVRLDRGGHAGGFNLRASDGALRVPQGSGSVLKSEPGALLHDMTGNGHDNVPFPRDTWGELTFTHEGANQRKWTVEWKAPRAGRGNITFYLAVLAANGDHANSPEDAWNLTSFLIPEGEGAPARSGAVWLQAVLLAGVASAVLAAWGLARHRARQRPDQSAPHDSRMVTCPDCGAQVRGHNLASHETKVHR